ncbi:unnamed protein product [Enterobius vermicularis]|uniref:S-protein homolog n=1 Tax=Enterobius vermicularis TaxID=51028 RepID=A0A0N4VAB8_ENTVE|nr:unnamed protein product [Enterobius vermicularis]
MDLLAASKCLQIVYLKLIIQLTFSSLFLPTYGVSDLSSIVSHDISIQLEELNVYGGENLTNPAANCSLTLHRNTCDSKPLSVEDKISWQTKLCIKWSCDIVQVYQREDDDEFAELSKEFDKCHCERFFKRASGRHFDAKVWLRYPTLPFMRSELSGDYCTRLQTVRTTQTLTGTVEN